MKVSYVTATGSTSKAYLDESPEDTEGPAVFTGTDKHTDEPVTLALTDAGWLEVPSA
ncbi:hypothetical protein SEA_MAIH_33 [Streptomyces phage Maih]|uniref:Uncharacterized protein n=5 Tax=Woodruffvirus TP1604 TaxID=1982746 RepID=A0A1P8VVY7_9CAUD|nr:hypothetical protein AVT62_gp34 [Streptomyces phage TP1604]ALY07283.1 hypothetical protein SEA_MAIH_33 [Streptomyces phage Maih]APZ82203.1 hypothetical protein SEA_BABYGOTBAC_35 [Streptomyces phage BabyGotBac]AWN08394.1 hypothetical protein SEA_BAYC_34 [Streptomyces phage BayC]AWN08464.1 hypothetical protein SEA_SALETE_34 [Streptomyces phage Salete]USH45409.1 hypothetical protein SEA_ASIS_34 [Streptomyces phage Asis]